MLYNDPASPPAACATPDRARSDAANSNRPTDRLAAEVQRRYAGTAGAVAQSLEQLVRVHFGRSFVHGLKPAQWQALRYFALAPACERTVTGFARYRCSTMGTASTTISTLVRKGYLGRAGDNPRNSGLYVTAAGYELLRDDPIHALVGEIAGLDPADQAALERTLPRLLARLNVDIG